MSPLKYINPAPFVPYVRVTNDIGRPRIRVPAPVRVSREHLVEGKEYLAFAPTGHEILGTYEKLTGRAEVSYWYRDGSIILPAHQGETEIFYDDQRTAVEFVNGRHEDVYLDCEGLEWTEDQLFFEEARA